MTKKLLFKFLGMLMLINIILILTSIGAVAEEVPFFCGSPIATGRMIEKEQFIAEWFEEKEYKYREELEAIDYYTSTERTVCIYDNGQEALFTSDSGFYFGNIIDSTTAQIYAFLQTEYGIWNTSSGYMSVSTYKSDDGYWVLGNLGDYKIGLFYIDMKNEKCYYRSILDSSIRLCTSDRYMMIYNKSNFMVIDRDKCEAQIIDFPGIELVPYFNVNGIAALIINSKYSASDQDYREDFYKYNQYYYYSWDSASVFPVSYMDYDYVCYADDNSIIVESEFAFNLIQNGEETWKIAKKDIVNNYTAMYSIQEGVLWQYGNGAYYYHTYLIPAKQILMEYAFGDTVNSNSKKIDLAYSVGWSGRYSDCHNYDLTDYSIDHKSVFDQLEMKVVLLNKYHRNYRIYNQGHVLWDNCLISSMGGDYGVYNFADESYNQRNIITTMVEESAHKSEIPVLELSTDAAVGKGAILTREDEHLRLTVEESVDPGSGVNTVVFPIQEKIDVTPYSYLSFQIKDLQGANTHWVTLTDANGQTVGRWVDILSVYGEWKRIDAPLSLFSGIDLSCLTEVSIGEWNSGDYLFNRVFFCQDVLDE